MSVLAHGERSDHRDEAVLEQGSNEPGVDRGDLADVAEPGVAGDRFQEIGIQSGHTDRLGAVTRQHSNDVGVDFADQHALDDSHRVVVGDSKPVDELG